MARVGLVLGSGGIVGAAWHAGALTAVSEVAGWDPRTADLIVGTSAGATVGANLRAGIDPRDHLALETGRPISGEGLGVLDRVQTRVELPAPDLGLRVLRPRSLPLLARSVTNWPPRPFLAATAALRSGRVSMDPLRQRANELAGTEWPELPLWLVCVQVRSGGRVVLGRDPVDVDDLGQAVAASSAVPGYFEPVVIGGRSHVDGGVHSCSNADLASDFEPSLDLVVIASPRTVVDAGITAPNRRFHRSVLDQEIAHLNDQGIATLVLEPTMDDIKVIGERGMNPRRTAAAADRAHLSLTEQLKSGAFDDALVTLAS